MILEIRCEIRQLQACVINQTHILYKVKVKCLMLETVPNFDDSFDETAQTKRDKSLKSKSTD